MTPYAFRIGDIGPEDLAVFQRIRDAREHIPEIPGEYVTCHAVVRLMAPLAPGFTVTDGTFHNYCQHSWLQKQGVIIDPYPIGGYSPLLVSTGGFSPWAQLYRKSTLPKETVSWFHRQLRTIRTGLPIR